MKVNVSCESMQDKINAKYEDICIKENLLPIKVSAFYQKKIDQEVRFLKSEKGPLHRIGYPSLEKITIRAPGEVADFVEDKNHMPNTLEDFVVQRYNDRILFITTSTCVGHCQYCFRQDLLSESIAKKEIRFDEKIDRLIAFLKQNLQIKEVIFSGGDPMTVFKKNLGENLLKLKKETSIESIRIHTKAIVYSPELFQDEEVLNILNTVNARLVFHITHPYEMCDEVINTIKGIQKLNIRCYNQFPILRNINDHPGVLIKHLKLLDENHIKNLSIFIADPIQYSAAFRISLPRLFEIIREFNWTSPSWINSTRFVLDSIIGKVRREDLISYDTKTLIAIFEREGKKIEYQDLPRELDIPGDLKMMLWKDYLVS